MTWTDKFPFASKGHHLSCPKGTVFFVQRELATKLYFILEGLIKLSIFTDSGEERIIEFIRTGRFLGAADVISGSAYGTAAIAYTDVQVASFREDQVKQLLGSDKEFSFHLARSLSQHSRALGRQLIGASFFPAIGRVGFALQNLAVQIGTPSKDGQGIDLSITHSELASYTGCNRVTVTRALADLVAEGLITKKKKALHIPDYHLLSQWLARFNVI